MRWYRLAAEQGSADAQFNLGVSYDFGEGVEEDDEEAVRWYRLAAEQGHADAAYNLGVSYVNYALPFVGALLACGLYAYRRIRAARNARSGGNLIERPGPASSSSPQGALD